MQYNPIDDKYYPITYINLLVIQDRVNYIAELLSHIYNSVRIDMFANSFNFDLIDELVTQFLSEIWYVCRDPQSRRIVLNMLYIIFYQMLGVKLWKTDHTFKYYQKI